MNIIPRRLDKYELVECLGHGGAAEVWKALDTQLQRFVAIKVLCPNLRDDPTFLLRFQREAQLIASLHHPNIVPIHDFQVFQSSACDQHNIPDIYPIAYMVMNYIKGSTLADYMCTKEKEPSPTEIVNLFTSISLAIDYAHHQGMIHRDIKPANILLDQRNTTRNPMGEPILTDFGIAKLLNASLTTQTGFQLGTPAYSSPEQMQGYSGNERSDLYSLAVILYEIVTGMLPFQGTPIDIMTQQIGATPVAPSLINPQVPTALSEVIMRGLEKDASHRFSSAVTMAIAVARALNVPVPEILRRPLDSSVMHERATAVKPTPPMFARSMPVESTMLRQGSDSPDEILRASSAPRRDQTGESVPVTPVLKTHGQAVLRSLSTIFALKKTGPRGRIIAIIALLLAVCVVAGLGIFLSVPGLLTPTNVIVGQAFYTSSEQRTADTAQGIADQMLIDLQNIAPAQSGKSYYVWLLGDKVKVGGDDLTGPPPIQPPILLTNNLLVNNGNAHYFFSGNTLHANLLSETSRLLITEEDANRSLHAPSTDHATWRYFAMFHQQPIPGDSVALDALSHIRHLLFNESHSKVLGLPGGLDYWLSRNTEKILEWSVTARDDWYSIQTTDAQVDLMKPMFVRILDYLDGEQNVHLDVPPDMPLLADTTGARVALLTVNPSRQGGENQATNPQGYIDHMQLHINQIAHAPDISSDMHLRASHMLTALRNAGGWLAHVRKDAITLFDMGNKDPMQLRQSEAGQLLDDMVAQATYAYIGQLDPVTNQVHPGVIQVHHDTQKLAVLSITKHLPSSL